MKKVGNKFDSNIVLIRFELVIRDRVGPYIDEVMQGVIGDELLAVEDLHCGETCVVTIVQPPLDVGLVLRHSCA